MHSRKAPGTDIPTETYRMGGKLMYPHYSKNPISIHVEQAASVIIAQGCHNRSYLQAERRPCDNKWGISLLSLADTRSPQPLVITSWTRYLPETQCHFRAGGCTADMIFVTHQLQVKFMEQHRYLYKTFVDLTKAFDTVSRDGLWKLMEKFDYQSTSIEIVR